MEVDAWIPSVPDFRGGILAEEPGLCKTLSVLRLFIRSGGPGRTVFAPS
jgi:hypothetical protein